MTVDTQQIQSWILAGLADSCVEVTGDGRHFEARVISAAFSGLNALSRHRLVYQALGDHMREDIHALSLITLTPAEARGES